MKLESKSIFLGFYRAFFKDYCEFVSNVNKELYKTQNRNGDSMTIEAYPIVTNMIPLVGLMTLVNGKNKEMFSKGEDINRIFRKFVFKQEEIAYLVSFGMPKPDSHINEILTNEARLCAKENEEFPMKLYDYLGIFYDEDEFRSKYHFFVHGWKASLNDSKNSLYMCSRYFVSYDKIGCCLSDEKLLVFTHSGSKGKFYNKEKNQRIHLMKYQRFRRVVKKKQNLIYFDIFLRFSDKIQELLCNMDEENMIDGIRQISNIERNSKLRLIG